MQHFQPTWLHVALRLVPPGVRRRWTFLRFPRRLVFAIVKASFDPLTSVPAKESIGPRLRSIGKRT